MSDMDLPPQDYGSDRYGYVELTGAPDGVRPSDAYVDALLESCGDCNPNLFLRWLNKPDAPEPEQWHSTLAHDETCPNVDRLAGEQA